MLVLSTFGKLACVVIKEKGKNVFASYVPVNHINPLQDASPGLTGGILLLREVIPDFYLIQVNYSDWK